MLSIAANITPSSSCHEILLTFALHAVPTLDIRSLYQKMQIAFPCTCRLRRCSSTRREPSNELRTLCEARRCSRTSSPARLGPRRDCLRFSSAFLCWHLIQIWRLCGSRHLCLALFYFLFIILDLRISSECITRYATKSGAKRIFSAAEVNIPPGAHDIYEESEALATLAKLIASSIDMKRWIFKIDLLRLYSVCHILIYRSLI